MLGLVMKSFKKTLVLGTAAMVVGAGFWAKQAFYTVNRVIDGDTFETTEHQLVRIAGIDAPELEYCGGLEAKAALEKLILNKRVYLKVVYRDPFQRLDSWVYTNQGSVALKMVQKGLAFNHNHQGKSDHKILDATNKAKLAKIGIFGPKCSQEKNPLNAKCNIKGNNLRGNKYYHDPSCVQYESTQVQLYLGDQWFCTEQEAKKAGYTKGQDC